MTKEKQERLIEILRRKEGDLTLAVKLFGDADMIEQAKGRASELEFVIKMLESEKYFNMVEKEILG